MLSKQLTHDQLPASWLLLYTLLIIVFTPSLCQLTLVTTTYPPFSDCSKYQLSNSTSVFGAEVNLIRSAFTFLNWTEGLDYAFECVYGSDAIRNRIRDPKPNDLGVFGGIALSHSRLQRGFKFSQSTISASVPLVHKDLNKPWFFVQSFTLITWGIVFLTVFIVGGIMHFMEDRKSDSIYMIYNVALQFFFAPDFPMSRFTSKVIQLFSLLLATILVYVFTAVSTNIFNANRGAGIKSLSDISNHVVMTNKMLGDYIKQYTSNLLIIDPRDILDPVESYNFDYLMIDGPYSHYLVMQHCELSIVIQQVDIINYGIVFTSNLQNETQINRGILYAKEEKEFEAYSKDYYASKSDMLLCRREQGLAAEKVLLHNARGLWYIYFVSIGIGLLMLMISFVKKKVKRKLNMYDLKGIRAKSDEKVQRRMATSVAMHAAVSIQAIEFLKRMGQEAVITYLVGSKVNLSKVALELAHKEFYKNRNDSDQKNFVKRLKTQLNLRHSSEKEIKWTGKIPKKTMKTLKIPRCRSSFLLQSMQSYQLAKTLTSKNIILSDQSSEIESDVNLAELLKKSQTIEKLIKNPNNSEGVKETKEIQKGVPFWQKLFGKKGIKVNKNMTMSATNLLKTKEDILIKELTRKKSEVVSSTSLSVISLPRAHTLNTPVSKNTNKALSPSSFRVKFFEDKQFRSAAEEDFSDADSSEFYSNSRFNDMVGFEVSSRSQTPLASTFRRHHLQIQEKLRKRIVERGFGEACDYEAQLEQARGSESSFKELSRYDFAKIVKMKRKSRRASKKDKDIKLFISQSLS